MNIVLFSLNMLEMAPNMLEMAPNMLEMVPNMLEMAPNILEMPPNILEMQTELSSCEYTLLWRKWVEMFSPDYRHLDSPAVSFVCAETQIEVKVPP